MRIRLNSRLIVRVALVAVTVYTTWSIGRAYWTRDDAHRRIAQAYDFVMRHGEVTSYLPCYCGCGKREGHSSLDSCFISRRDEFGRVVSRSTHAETCRICIDVALAAERMVDGGANVGTVLASIESDYGAAHGFRTDTPAPPDPAGRPTTHQGTVAHP